MRNSASYQFGRVLLEERTIFSMRNSASYQFRRVLLEERTIFSMRNSASYQFRSNCDKSQAAATDLEASSWGCQGVL
jgi:hypothetical protein